MLRYFRVFVSCVARANQALILDRDDACVSPSPPSTYR